MQKMFILGFVGRDPEERYTSGGKKVVSFPVAVSVMKNKEKMTVWYKVNCWDEKFSGIMPHIKKGNSLVIMGELNAPTTYQNKNGDIAIDLSINANSIDFCPISKNENKEEPKIEEKYSGKDPSVFDFGEI